MADKFQNKYRIPSARLQNWDYGSNGAYFITICTKNREHYFGYVEGGKMFLSEMGQLAESFWMEIPNQFNYVELGNFVVMPNHVHGILIINKSHTAVETRLIASNDIETQFIASNDIETQLIAPDVDQKETRLIASVREEESNIGGFAGDNNPMLQENISKIIRWYKGRCSFEIRKLHADFGWHSRFHDHIIRNAISFENIQNYIRDNPEKWKDDRLLQ